MIVDTPSGLQYEEISEGGDLFAATVILASRIAAKAEGGKILVEPVRVSEVNWRDTTAS
jgi:hypothetical protein